MCEIQGNHGRQSQWDWCSIKLFHLWSGKWLLWVEQHLCVWTHLAPGTVPQVGALKERIKAWSWVHVLQEWESDCGWKLATQASLRVWGGSHMEHGGEVEVGKGCWESTSKTEKCGPGWRKACLQGARDLTGTSFTSFPFNSQGEMGGRKLLG